MEKDCRGTFPDKLAKKLVDSLKDLIELEEKELALRYKQLDVYLVAQATGIHPRYIKRFSFECVSHQQYSRWPDDVRARIMYRTACIPGTMAENPGFANVIELYNGEIIKLDIPVPLRNAPKPRKLPPDPPEPEIPF